MKINCQHFYMVIFNKDKSRGAILIEFAIAIPLLIIILYYATDLPKVQSWKTKMKNVTYMAVSMIQNISQSRTDKRITPSDLSNIINTVFFDSCYHKTFGYEMHLLYVEGRPNNKAVVRWRGQISAGSNRGRTSVQFFLSGEPHPSQKVNSDINFTINTECDPSNIDKDLKIQNGEIKMIMQTNTFLENTNNIVNNQRAFGLYLLPLKHSTLRASGSNTRYLFPNVIIFTPCPGLFTSTVP